MLNTFDKRLAETWKLKEPLRADSTGETPALTSDTVVPERETLPLT